VCPYAKYNKLKIYISELILDGYQYMPVTNVTEHCIVIKMTVPHFMGTGSLIRYSTGNTKKKKKKKKNKKKKTKKKNKNSNKKLQQQI